MPESDGLIKPSVHLSLLCDVSGGTIKRKKTKQRFYVSAENNIAQKSVFQQPTLKSQACPWTHRQDGTGTASSHADAPVLMLKKKVIKSFIVMNYLSAAGF